MTKVCEFFFSDSLSIEYDKKMPLHNGAFKLTIV